MKAGLEAGLLGGLEFKVGLRMTTASLGGLLYNSHARTFMMGDLGKMRKSMDNMGRIIWNGKGMLF